MSLQGVIAVAVGVAADRALGEPPTKIHPVAIMGNGLARLERLTYSDSRGHGTIHLVLGCAPVLLGAQLAQSLFGPAVATALSTWSASASSMLGAAANEVAEALAAGDLEQARRLLPALVGRDPENLAESEIVRAVIESLAENTVDAVTATIFFGQAFGAKGIWLHRAVNTLDAMVGHRSPRYANFGWAAARLDDALNWIPARLSVAAVALAMPSRASQVLELVERDGSKHPSPNGGRIEAAYAASLGITLGGNNHYEDRIEQRGPLGDGPAPGSADIARAIGLSRRVEVVATIAPLIAVALSSLARRGSLGSAQ